MGRGRESGSTDKSSRMYNQRRRGQGYSGGRGRGQGRGAPRHSRGSGGWTRKLAENMSGFLCSCNMNEKDCVKEAMNLLNEYVRDEDMEKNLVDNPLPAPPGQDLQDSHQLEEPSGEAIKGEEGLEKSEMVDDEDIEGALAAEIHELKSQSVRTKFMSLDTGVPNLVFISSTVKDPPGLAHRILEDILEKKEIKSRFLLRLLPIETTCWASMDKIEGACRRLFPKYFAGNFTSFQILYKSRYNCKLERGEVIKLLADLVTQVNPLNVVDLTNPKLSVIVEVVKNIVCIGVVPDWVKLKKFNLHEAGALEENQITAATATTIREGTSDGKELQGVPVDASTPEEGMEGQSQSEVEMTQGDTTD